jgi:hypothetical protein
MARYFLLLSQSTQLILLTKSLWILTKVGYNLFKPLQTLPLPWCPRISILTLNPSFQTLWIGIMKYLLSRQSNIKVKSNLRLDRPPRPIQARMQWCYLHLSPQSPKYRHPPPKDAYFLVQERVVRSADLVLRGISYILSSRRGDIIGPYQARIFFFDLFYNCWWTPLEYLHSFRLSSCTLYYTTNAGSG